MSFPTDIQIDQATELRTMIQQAARSRVRHTADSKPVAQSLAITSGKGGVGKTVLALNLAVALSQQGQRVCLLDATRGSGHLAFLCGLGYDWDLRDVLNGSRKLRDIQLTGPAGIQLIPGAGSLPELLESREFQESALPQELSQLDHDFDFILIDCETGLQSTSQTLARHAQSVLLISTLEPTSLTDTYSVLKNYRQAEVQDVRIWFNRCYVRRAQQAIGNLKRTAEHYLHINLPILGCVPDDPVISQSLLKRLPAMLLDENAVACREIQSLAASLIARKAESPPQSVRPFIPAPTPETSIAA